MSKKQNRNQKVRSFRFNDEIVEALDQLVLYYNWKSLKHESPKHSETKTKTKALEDILALFLKAVLKNDISKYQLNLCKDNHDICKLFTFYVKAMQNLNGFKFHKPRNKKRGFVYNTGFVSKAEEEYESILKDPIKAFADFDAT